MAGLMREQVADIKRRLRMHPIEFEERISTLDKPLIIESACPGWQPKYWGPRELYRREPVGYKENGIRFPAVPVSLEEQARMDIEAIKAGAAAIHHHPRDPRTGISVEGNPLQTMHTELQAKIIDLVFREVDAVTIPHTWKAKGPIPTEWEMQEQMSIGQLVRGIDYITYIKEALALGKGNRYVQGAVVLWPPGHSYPPGYVEAVQEAIRFMEANNIKPVHKLRSSYNVKEMHRVLIETGVMTQTPFVLVHDMGHPRGWPMDVDPWMPIDLITSIEQTKKRIPDSIIGVFSGSRNWMPITMTAILAGVDLVRVGIEDCYWLYPHKDEIIESNTQVVKLIVDFAHMIGREVATPQQAREIMGMKLTSEVASTAGTYRASA